LRRVSAEEVYSPLNVYDTINGDEVHLSDNYVNICSCTVTN